MKKLLLFLLTSAPAVAMNDNNEPPEVRMYEEGPSFFSKENHTYCCQTSCAFCCVLPSFAICSYRIAKAVGYNQECRNPYGCTLGQQIGTEADNLLAWSAVVLPVVGAFEIGPKVAEQTYRADQKLKTLLDRCCGKEKTD